VAPRAEGRSAQTERSLLSDATAALEAAHIDPERASTIALDVLARAGRTAADARAVSVAERAIGLAARERHDLPGSVLHLRRAARIAERAGLAACGAEARLSLVGTLALSGNWNGAMREADRAGAVLRGVMLARLESQRAHLHLEMGHLDEALAGFRRALRTLRRGSDKLGEAHALASRAFVYLERGAVAASVADLRRAEEL
jgi:tetratricopeptide (TPR) repeat protein